MSTSEERSIDSRLALARSQPPGPELRKQLWGLVVERDWPAQVTQVRADLGRIWARLLISAWHPDVEGAITEASAKTDLPMSEGDWISLKLRPRWTPSEKAKSPPAFDVQILDKSEVDELRATEVQRLKDDRDLLVIFSDLQGQRAELDEYRNDLNEQWQEAAKEREDADALIREAERSREVATIEKGRIAELQAHVEALIELQEEERREMDRRLKEFEDSGGPAIAEALDLRAAEDGQLKADSTPAPRPLASGIIDAVRTELTRTGHGVSRAELERALILLLIAGVTGDLLLFGGQPGSGKSTLLTQLAKCLGASATVMPARPAWLDSADLLGFFDHRAGLYRPTEFVDALLRAHLQPNQLTVVVIDEINIARIENYAADVLSQLERAKDAVDGGALNLYPEWERRNALREFALIADSADQFATERARTMARYPPSLAIPQNLVVSGTLNNDESTYELSAKVRDRSLVLVVEASLPDRIPRDAGGIASPAWPIDLQELWLVGTTPEDGPDLAADESWKGVRDLNSVLVELGVGPSHRFVRALRAGSRIAARLGIAHAVMLDGLLLGKVLSGVVVLRGDKTRRDALTRLQGEFTSRGLASSAAALARVDATLEHQPMAKVL